MALTRRLLKEWQLEDAMIERIIAAHAATVHALKEERDQAQAQAAGLVETQKECDALRSQVEELVNSRQLALDAQAQLENYQRQAEEERSARKAEKAVRRLLEDAGCNPHAVELLCPMVKREDILWEEDKVLNGQALLEPVLNRYGAFFAREETLPTQRMNPPIAAGGALSPKDIARMSNEEINDHWHMIKDVLTKGANR